MAKANKSNSIEARLAGILRSLSDATDGLEWVYLVGLDNNEIVASFPRDEAEAYEFIASLSGDSANHFESQGEKLGHGEVQLIDMEVITDRWRIYTHRIAKEYLLCLVGEKTRFKSGITKRLVENRFKESIVTELQREGVPVTTWR